MRRIAASRASAARITHAPGGPLARLVVMLAVVAVALVGAPAFGPRRAAAAPAAVTVDQLADQALALLNGERQAHGLAPLTRDNGAAAVAVARANDMAAGGYLAHVSPSGEHAVLLLTRNGVDYRIAGENIGRSNFDDSAVSGVMHRGWMASEGHRANMLDPNFQGVGIGVALRGDTWYFAMVLVG